MRVFIAGATGTIGRPVVKRLVAAGHEVIGLTRSGRGVESLEREGAAGVIGDALDRDGLERIVAEAQPTHVLHLLTAIPREGAMKPRDLEATNVLRTRGTANLLRASIAAGVKRIVAESFVLAYGLADLGAQPLREPQITGTRHPDREVQAIVDALRSLENQMRDAAESGAIESIVLRYGFLYGPGVPSTEAMVAGLQRRKIPLVRNTAGIASFVHIDDAANATVAALERGKNGSIYNIADDRPTGFSDFVIDMARTTGAPQPPSVPRLLARLFAPFALEMASVKVPMSNARARGELAWNPRYATPREGLVTLAAGS